MEYRKPSTQLLHPVQEYDKGKRILKSEAESIKERLSDAFRYYRLNLKVTNYTITPLSVVFHCETLPGFNMKTFSSARRDLFLHIGREFEFRVNPIEESVIELAVLYIGRSIIGLRELIQNDEFGDSDSVLTIAAGVSIYGEYIYLDLENAPHMLIEGTTGSGKTIFIDDILLSLIYKSSPSEVRFLLVDPKRVDLMPYEGIQHLLEPVITDMSLVNKALEKISEEIDRRYEIFGKSKVRDIDSYNMQNDDKLYKIVVVLDEYKEMIDKAGKGVESLVIKLTSSGRAVGVHVVIASQSAASYVIPGSIKSNLTASVNFSNVSLVIGADGKTRLLGEGDMLTCPGYGANTVRAKAAYVSFEEMNDVVKSVRHRNVSKWD